MIRKLLITAGLIVATSGLSLQVSAQTVDFSNQGEGSIEETSYSSRYALKKDRQLMSQDLRQTNTGAILKTEEGFFVRYVDKDKKTVEIAQAQSVMDRKKGIYSEDVVIPETLHVKDGSDVVPCTVVAIGKAAFAFNEVYTVSYPATCTEIKDRAFAMTAIKEAVIPDQIEKIGDNVYFYCQSLSKIQIGKGLKKVGDAPFQACPVISSIQVDAENSLFSEKDGLLYNKEQTILYICPSQRKNIVSVTLPNTVKVISENAFNGCRYLKKIVLNEGLEKIEIDAFTSCEALEEMVIPASVTEIAPGAFYQLKKYDAFKVAEGNKVYEVKSDGTHEGKLLIDKVKNSLHTCLYKGTTAVTIPDGITIVEPYAFMGCSWTASIKFPESVDSVGRATFSELYSLTEIEIPEKVRVIPKYCISDCDKLTKITLGKNVTLVEDQAFASNGTLETKGGTLQILAVTPPAVGRNDDRKLYDMGEDFYSKVVLEVPADAKEAYKKDKNWRKFNQIYTVGNELVQTASPLQISVAGGLLSIVAPEVAPIAIYTLDGQVVYTTTALETQVPLPTGLYLVTYGSETIKVLVD